MRKYGTKLSFPSNLHEIFNVFHIFFIRFGVPEDDTEFNSISLLISKDQDPAREIAPFIIGPHSCHIYV
jgi:hypothetical protein